MQSDADSIVPRNTHLTAIGRNTVVASSAIPTITEETSIEIRREPENGTLTEDSTNCVLPNGPNPIYSTQNVSIKYFPVLK